MGAPESHSGRCDCDFHKHMRAAMEHLEKAIEAMEYFATAAPKWEQAYLNLQKARILLKT